MTRIYIYAAIALALLGACLYVNRLQAKASRVDAAEARVVAVEKEKAALAKTFADAAKANRGIADDLAAFRSELGAQSLSFSQALKSKPLIREVIHEGNTVPCVERDPVRYSELFNRAVTGAASP